MRVRSFGGPLRHWRPGSSLLSPDLRLILLRNSSRAHMLRYALRALTGIAPYDGLEKRTRISHLSPPGRSAAPLRA